MLPAKYGSFAQRGIWRTSVRKGIAVRKFARTIAAVGLLLSSLLIASPAHASHSCIIDVNASTTGTGVLTIWFYGAEQCSQSMVRLTAFTRLFSASGTLEAQGQYCDRWAATYCDSRGSFYPGVVGSVHRVNFQGTLTLPAPHFWASLPPDCTGLGTQFANCIIDREMIAGTGVILSESFELHST